MMTKQENWFQLLLSIEGVEKGISVSSLVSVCEDKRREKMHHPSKPSISFSRTTNQKSKGEVVVVVGRLLMLLFLPSRSLFDNGFEEEFLELKIYNIHRIHVFSSNSILMSID